ncbi:hypothetical protein GCM10010402_20520 [Actinomadura luteofluorescens]
MLRHDIYDLDPLPSYAKGRIALSAIPPTRWTIENTMLGGATHAARPLSMRRRIQRTTTRRGDGVSRSHGRESPAKAAHWPPTPATRRAQASWLRARHRNGQRRIDDRHHHLLDGSPLHPTTSTARGYAPHHDFTTDPVQGANRPRSFRASGLWKTGVA